MKLLNLLRGGRTRLFFGGLYLAASFLTMGIFLSVSLAVMDLVTQRLEVPMADVISRVLTWLAPFLE